MHDQGKKRGGCGWAVVIVVLLVGAVVAALAGFVFLFHLRSSEAPEAPAIRERVKHTLGSTIEGEPEMVVLRQADLGRYSPAGFGDKLTREHFVAMMADNQRTGLARASFAKAADGRAIRWRLRTVEVTGSDDAGVLEGRFEIPYRIQLDPTNSSISGNVAVYVAFQPNQLEPLLKLRRNDWATVEGTLQFDRSNPRIVDARVVSGD